MYLRDLKIQDAPWMLEWMHDKHVVENMGTNFMTKSLEDCQNFIQWAKTANQDLHLAVTDEMDEYMGTVSLKHIADGTAEFAITVRACAMGKGFSAFGMDSILKKGLFEMGLEKVYWCVSPDNKRAVRFYDKYGYPRVSVDTLNPQGYTKEQESYFIWYAVTKEDYGVPGGV